MNIHKHENWVIKVQDINKTCSLDLFKLIKNLNGKNMNNNNQAIKFKGEYISSAYGLANAFNHQYCSIMRHTTSDTHRKIWKENKKFELNDNIKVTTDQTREEIKKAKASKAIGPDKISNVHQQLVPKAVEYLTQIFNLSLSCSVIPDIWKKSVVVPLLELGKFAQESNSYQPVSLLCPAIKILERLILPIMTEHLPIPDFQHGFRKNTQQ